MDSTKSPFGRSDSSDTLGGSQNLTPTTTPIKNNPGGLSIQSTVYNTGATIWNIGGSLINWGGQYAGKTLTSMVVGQLKGGIDGCEPISEEMNKMLRHLDLSNQLPQIIHKFVVHQVTKEFMTDIAPGREGDLQTFLEFMTKHAIASLACYRLIKQEDVDKLPMAVIKNFILIINQWIIKTGLQEKLQTCKCLRVTTAQSIKQATKSYEESYAVIAKNKGDTTKSLAYLKTVYEKEKLELHDKEANELKALDEFLKKTVAELATTLFDVSGIPEDVGLQAMVFKYLSLRAKLEKYLFEFIHDFYLQALPRGASSSGKDPLDKCIFQFRSKNSDKNACLSLNSSNSYHTPESSNNSSLCSSLSEDESEGEIRSLKIPRKKTDPSKLSFEWGFESQDTPISNEIILNQVIEPELPPLQKGILGIVEVVLFKCTKSLREEASKKKTIEAVAGFLSNYGITEVEIWIGQVLSGLGVADDSLIAQFRSSFVECLAYRFIEVIEKLAVYKPRSGLDLLESLLVNSIELTKEHLHLNAEFFIAIKEYEKLVLLDEAYGWRDHYLQSQLKVKPDKCDDKAGALRSAAVLEIFKLSKCDTHKIQVLLGALEIELPKGDLSKIDVFLTDPTRLPLVDFFQKPRKKVQIELQEFLTKYFGQFAAKFVEVTGLNQDEAIGFGSFIDLSKVRTQTIPKLLLDAYCMVADLEERPLQKVQDQILIRFIEKFSKQENGEDFEQDSLLFGNVIKALDETRFLKDDEVQLFSDKLAQAGYTWFSVINFFMEQQLQVPEKFQTSLQILDPNAKLPLFCESLRNKILEESKKKIVKEIEKLNQPVYMHAYTAANENSEIQKFAELYLDALLSRIFTKLACEWKERQPNGLFSNIFKMILHSIKNVNEPGNITDGLLRGIGIEKPSDLEIIVLPFGNGKIEKLAFDEVKKQLPLLLTELYAGFFILNKAQNNLITIEGYKNLESDSIILSKNIIPMAFRWMGDEKNRISLAHTVKDLLDENKIEEIDRTWVEELLVGTAILEYDRWSLILEAYEWRDKYLQGQFSGHWQQAAAELTTGGVEKIFELARYGKKKIQALLKAVKKPVVDGQSVKEEEVFVEFFRADGFANAKEQKCLHTPGKDQVQHLWTFFEEILAPRIFRIFEHTAHYNAKATGNILERVLVNSITVIHDAFLGEGSLLPVHIKEAITEYDRLSLLVEAYDWRNRYLKEEMDVKAAECEDDAESLKLDDVRKICQEHFDKNQYELLIRAILNLPVDSPIDNEEANKALLKFFQSSSDEVRKEKQNYLSFSFGPAAEKILNLAGLTNDAAFSLPGASEGPEGYYTLESVRTQIVPQILMNFYRDMSDFNGVHANNMEEFNDFFGNHHEVAAQFLNTFSHIAAEKAQIYLRDNAEKIAKMLSELFPSAPLEQIDLLSNAIYGIVSSNLKSPEVNAAASQVIYRMIEERIFGSLVHLVVSLIEQEGRPNLSEEDNSVNDQQPNLNFFARAFSTSTAQKESVKSKMQEKDLEESFDRRIFSKWWFSNILQLFGDLFNTHRDDLKRGMKEYWGLEKEQNFSLLIKGQQEEKKAKKLQAIFLPLALEIIQISGLSSENLNLPEFCQEDIWENFTQDMLPKLMGKFYIEMTVQQNSQKEEAGKLKKILPHGPGAATGFAHLIVKMLESNLSIDGNGMGGDLYSVLIAFLIDSGSESGRLAAKGLGAENNDEDELTGSDSESELEEILESPIAMKKIKIQPKQASSIIQISSPSNSSEKISVSDSVKASFNEIISDAVRSESLTALFSSLERYIAPPIQKILSAITINLGMIDNPGVLKKIAQQCILAAGDHFKRIHSVAIKENKESAYELVDSPSKLLDGVSSNPAILEYVFLEEKKLKALAAYNAAKERESQCYITQAMKAERTKTRIALGEALSHTRKVLRRYARSVWTGKGDEVKKYLAAERNLRAADRELASKKDSMSQWFMHLIDSEKGSDELQKAQENRQIAVICLENACQSLANVMRNVAGGQNDFKADPLRNLCSMEGYRQLRKALEDAEKEWKASKVNTPKAEEAKELYDKALKDFESYRIENYFTPLTGKILKLVGEQPFDALDFPLEIPLETKRKMIEKIKNKLPEVLNALFHTLVKPETQQGILLKFIKDANKASQETKGNQGNENTIPVESVQKKEMSEANDFESRCGSMALDLIEMMPKGSLEIFHRLSTVKDAIEVGGGKFIGDTLSKSLEETSIVQLFDSLLKLALSSSMPLATWDDELKFTPFMEDLPKTPEELIEAKEKQTKEARQTKINLQNELTIFMENEIASPINAYLREVGKGFMSGVKVLIENIFSKESSDDVFKSFENFAKNVYALFAALVNLIASVTVWPVARWFIGTMPQDIAETFSLEAHEHLVFQWVNIVMDTIDEELENQLECEELSRDY